MKSCKENGIDCVSSSIIPTSPVNKYDRFEKWLVENQSEFSLLELRSYDDNVNNVKHSRNDDECSQGDSEEKKEMPPPPKTTSSTSSNPMKSSSSSSPSSSTDKQSNHESEMRGVHAKVDIPPNTICVSIPKKCLITVEMGQATEIGQIILKSDLDLDAPKHIFLMIFLLYDRKINGEKSFFKPYYDILPKTLHNIPIFWSEDELKYLEGSYLLSQIADRNEAITDDYYSICEVAPQLSSIATIEEFKWARMCVCSRNFGLQIDGHRTSALVPHADMLNHQRPRETKWTYDDDLQAFTITTLQRIPRGAQVYDSYGQKCNHRFLLNYGFAVEDNNEIDGFCPNEVPVELKVPSNDPFYDKKQSFWTRGDAEGHSHLGSHPSANITAAVAAAVDAARAQQLDPAIAMHTAMRAAVNAATTDSLNKRGYGYRTQGSGPSESLKRVRVCVSNNENTRVLFSMLRVLACNEEELNIISSSPTLPFGDSGCSGFLNRALRGFTGGHQDNSVPPMQQLALIRTARDIRHPLNLRNEKAAMKLLLQLIETQLNRYPCTLAQDVADLMDKELFPQFSNRRHAKIQVRGEKEVLHHFALWAQTAVDVIEIIEKEILIAKKKSRETIPPQNGYESVTRKMEENERFGSNGLHHTIVRYCCDVLGALRKEGFSTIEGI